MDTYSGGSIFMTFAPTLAYFKTGISILAIVYVRK